MGSIATELNFVEMRDATISLLMHCYQIYGHGQKEQNTDKSIILQVTVYEAMACFKMMLVVTWVVLESLLRAAW